MRSMRNIRAVSIVQNAEFVDLVPNHLTIFVILRYNNINQTRLRQKAEDKPFQSAHLTERMLTR